jgi:diadenosine tetraphosphate (Ap4A) HIT family hydrolase
MPCPLCAPRPDNNDAWLKVATLATSTLYLDRNQTYRGHCQLIYDRTHVVGAEDLLPEEFAKVAADLHRAAQAITRVCRPDRMNYASLGNVVPHLHWHLIPRYRMDPRWGQAIWTSDPKDMPVTRAPEQDLQRLAAELRAALELRTT